MKNNTGDYKKTIESATILGKMAKVLEEYEGLEDEHIVEKWFSKKSLQNGIPKMIELQKNLKEDNKYKEKFYNDLDEKIKISKILEKEFDFEITKKMTFMNAHGDYSVQQLIYNDKEGTTVIDFETAKKLPIIWEVMRSYSYIDKEAVNGILNIDTLIEYVKEFSKYVTLNKYDLMYAPHIYLMQIVSSVFGYKQYNENYEKVGLLEFAFFRTNLCKFLYEHLNEISERLQNEIL